MLVSPNPSLRITSPSRTFISTNSNQLATPSAATAEKYPWEKVPFGEQIRAQIAQRTGVPEDQIRITSRRSKGFFHNVTRAVGGTFNTAAGFASLVPGPVGAVGGVYTTARNYLNRQPTNEPLGASRGSYPGSGGGGALALDSTAPGPMVDPNPGALSPVVTLALVGLIALFLLRR